MGGCRLVDWISVAVDQGAVSPPCASGLTGSADGSDPHKLSRRPTGAVEGGHALGLLAGREGLLTPLTIVVGDAEADGEGLGGHGSVPLVDWISVAVDQGGCEPPVCQWVSCPRSGPGSLPGSRGPHRPTCERSSHGRWSPRRSDRPDRRWRNGPHRRSAEG